MEEGEGMVSIIVAPAPGGIMLPWSERDAVAAMRVDDMQRVLVQFCPEIRDRGWYTSRNAFVCTVPASRVLAEIDMERISR
jgi:hypothetical protein